MSVVCTKPLIYFDAATNTEDRFLPRRGGVVELVADDHRAVKAHPECFAPAPDRFERRTGARSLIRPAIAPAKPSLPLHPRPRGLEPHRLPTSIPNVRVTHRRGETSVRISGDAHRAIAHALDRTKLDGLESLAVLFGVADSDLIEVVSAVDASCERTPTSVRIEPGATIEAIEEAAERGLALIGTAHSHPRSGYVVPSEADLQLYRMLRRFENSERLLAIIGIPTATSWHLEPWVVVRGHRIDVCERARHCVAIA